MYLVAVLANWRAGHGPQGALEIEFEGVNETRSKYEDSNKLKKSEASSISSIISWGCLSRRWS